jgi:hypothetical protein
MAPSDGRRRALPAALRAFGYLLLIVAGGRVADRAAADQPPRPSLNDLAWLAGSWMHRDGATHTQEHWLPPKGDMLPGLSRTVVDGQRPRASFEFLRIPRSKEDISYFASPQGRPATEFPLVAMEANKVVLEHPQHDFPQKISYWLDSEGALHAQIEGVIQGRPRQRAWKFTKAGST